ncbi:MAG: phosphotransferase [Bacteroidales bacterium]|jgi:aminoglycoside/choline kinase family phosphotransferase|nr:phosphotransferase [Bacteroidales bacterium]
MVELLPQSGSNRKYYRIKWDRNSVIAVYNTNIAENRAYLDYSKQLLSKSIPIPEILYASALQQEIYFVEDLGDTTFFSLIEKDKATTAANSYTPTEKIRTLYKQAITDLLKIQIEGGKNFNYTHAFPTPKFDKQAMLWDMNYFKYMFLHLTHTSFNETALENDFNTLIKLLNDNIPSGYFLYRDFQTRNIMIKDNTLYYIDFQGGRQGALQYDLTSLLYNAQANLSDEFRTQMLDYYCEKLQENYPDEAAKQSDFKKTFYCFAILRILQAIGGYGYRGFYEHKHLFIDSIPYAMRNLANILEKHPLDIPEIHRIVNFYGREISPCGKTPASSMNESARISSTPSACSQTPASAINESKRISSTPFAHGQTPAFAINESRRISSTSPACSQTPASAINESKRTSSTPFACSQPPASAINESKRISGTPSACGQSPASATFAQTPTATQTEAVFCTVSPLTITVQSFSYRNPLPSDPAGNGGGFIFDCRYLPNPGRQQQYKQLTGKDTYVIDFLAAIPEVTEFIQRAAAIVLPAIEAYRQRGFTHLQVNFGCTGGRHRSVYCAEIFADKIKQSTNTKIIINHLNI